EETDFLQELLGYGLPMADAIPRVDQLWLIGGGSPNDPTMCGGEGRKSRFSPVHVSLTHLPPGTPRVLGGNDDVITRALGFRGRERVTDGPCFVAAGVLDLAEIFRNPATDAPALAPRKREWRSRSALRAGDRTNAS